MLTAAGAGAGVAAPYAVRHQLDTDENDQRRIVVDRFGDFGTPSALFGIGTGVAGLAVAGVDQYTDMGDSIPDTVSRGAAPYGTAALATGVVSGLSPVGEGSGTTQGFRVESRSSGSGQTSRVNGQAQQTAAGGTAFPG